MSPTKFNELIAPADSRLTYFKIDDDLRVQIKQSIYSIGDILGDNKEADAFRGGTCLVFRMTLTDNHWYYFIDNGKFKSALARPVSNGAAHNFRNVDFIV